MTKDRWLTVCARNFSAAHEALQKPLIVKPPQLLSALAFVVAVAVAPNQSSAAPIPLASYSFDDGAGTTLADQSGNGRSGTLVNGPTWTTGRSGSALRFDGSNDYVTAGDIAAADGLTTVTVSAWVKFSASGGGAAETHIVDKSHCSGSWNGGPWELGVSLTRAHKAEFLIYGKDGSPAAYMFSGASTTSVDDGNWHYVTGRYDGSRISIWVDGVQENSYAVPQVKMPSTSYAVQLGGQCNGYAYPFAGSLDDVRIYGSALSDSDIVAEMNSTGGAAPPPSSPPPAPPPPSSPPPANAPPALSYGFENASGTAVTDQSGAGNHGTVVNGATWSQGKYGVGLQFDGSNDHVSVADSSSLSVAGSQLTVSAWVAPSTSSSTRVIVGKPYSATSHSGTTYSYALYANSSNRIVFHLTSGSTPRTLTTTQAIPTNSWSHVSGVYDGVNMRIYVNGVEQASRTASGNVNPYATPLRVGTNGGLSQFWRGAIDDVRIVASARSAAQLQSEMATPIGGSAQQPPPQQPPPPASDVTAPSVPAGLSSSNVTSSQVTLAWQAATDNTGVTGYRVFRNGVSLGTATVLNYTATGLAANTSHSFTVAAFDAAGNNSAQSAALAVTTAAAASGNTYSTNFDANENPISEGGVWRRANNSWTNVQTVGGVAFGTNGVTNLYDDSYSLLSGFGPNHTATAVIYRDENLSPGSSHEVELLLRFSDDANNARGYECLFSWTGVADVVRWNGRQGDVTFLPQSNARGLGRPLRTGDVIKASISGSEIRLYINDILITTAVDSAITTGQPGISFFIRPDGSQRLLGLTSYSVTSP